MSKKNTNDENLITTAIENAAAALENAASSIVTDYIKENVEYRASSGLNETIIREELASCCKWCHALAGEYEYGLEPSDVYRRHDNCKCIVLFKSTKGYQNVWSKNQYSSKAEAKTEARAQVTKPAEKKKKAEKRIAQEQTSEEMKAKNVGWEYRRNATPGQGKIQGTGNKESAEWLFEKYGGNIELVDDANLIWNGDKWNLETPSAVDGIDSVNINGNAIVDLRNIPADDLMEALDKADAQLKKSNRDLDAIIRMKQNGQDITTILRYKK
jgi:hypothetical protein